MEARRRLAEPRFIYPPGLIGPMASLFAPPGPTPHLFRSIPVGALNGRTLISGWRAPE